MAALASRKLTCLEEIGHTKTSSTGSGEWRDLVARQ